MTTTQAGSLLQIALSVAWWRMAVAISFWTTQLKVLAPGMSTTLGARGRRLVFQALNAIELVLAVILAVVLWLYPDGGSGEFVVLVTLGYC